jgi:hypothetical protein
MGKVLEPFWQISHNAATAAGVTKKSRRFINLLSLLTISIRPIPDKVSFERFPEHEICERAEFHEYMWGSRLTFAGHSCQDLQRSDDNGCG